MEKRKRGKGKPSEGWEVGLGGVGIMFKGLADLVEKLGELAEKGETLSRTGEFQGKSGVRGIYGFNVKVGGLGREKGFQVEPFGNIRRDEKTGDTVVQEIREPVVDIFEEKDYTLVVAEMPGISAKDVRLEVKDDLLTIYAEKGDKKYRKEVLLPHSYPRAKMKVSCNNGILEIKCIK
jgi:HSP20 family protein